MRNYDDKYPGYLLRWMERSGTDPVKAADAAIVAFVWVNQAITVLSGMGLEPVDSSDRDPRHIGSGLWHLDNCLQEVLLAALAPMLDGTGLDDALMILDEAVCQLAEDGLAAEEPLPDDVIASRFYEILRGRLRGGDDEMPELIGQIADMLEDAVDTEEAVFVGGLFDAVADATVAAIRHHLSVAGNGPDGLAAAAMPRIVKAIHAYDPEIEALLAGQYEGIAEELGETFRNWAGRLEEFRRKHLTLNGDGKLADAWPVEYEQPMIDAGHRHSLWYGGDVLSVRNGNHVFTLRANGDVIAEYQSDPEDKTAISVRDKSCHGVFYEKLHGAIGNDEELDELSHRDQSPCHAWLEILDNNWWEVFVTDADGNEVGSFVMDSEYYDEALEEMLAGMAGMLPGLED